MDCKWLKLASRGDPVGIEDNQVFTGRRSGLTVRRSSHRPRTFQSLLERLDTRAARGQCKNGKDGLVETWFQGPRTAAARTTVAGTKLSGCEAEFARAKDGAGFSDKSKSACSLGKAHLGQRRDCWDLIQVQERLLLDPQGISYSRPGQEGVEVQL